jgi:50S ribosomal subunit-associated GTPase HflX
LFATSVAAEFIVESRAVALAECLVIGEITCDTMVVVINKLDLVPKEKREETVEKVRNARFRIMLVIERTFDNFEMKKKLSKALSKTRFADSTMVAVAAKLEEGKEEEGLIGQFIIIDIFPAFSHHQISLCRHF